MHPLLQQIKRDLQIKNLELIANGALTKLINFLFDLKYNVYSQLTELCIKHKPGTFSFDEDDYKK